MPTYEYECNTCNQNFEVFQSMSDPVIKNCPKCGNEVRRLIFGGSGVIFKGSGFYATDKSASKPAQKEQSEVKTTADTAAQPKTGEDAGKKTA
jgi:putative FmdB family regulatory protein